MTDETITRKLAPAVEIQSRRLSLRVLGTLWMPGVQAASSETLNIGTGPFQTDIDPTDPDEVQTWADCHLGDFSSIDAIDAELVETGPTHYEHGPDGWKISSTYTRSVQVLSFTDDQELAWSDAMFGSEEG